MWLKNAQQCSFYIFCYFKESEVSDASSTSDKKEANKSSSDEEEDISTALVKEIDELRTKHEMPLSSRRFQVCRYVLSLYSIINETFLHDKCIVYSLISSPLV